MLAVGSVSRVDLPNFHQIGAPERPMDKPAAITT
jgi:hypothetical protein